MQKLISAGTLMLATTLFAANADARSTRLEAHLNGAQEVIDKSLSTDVVLPIKGLLTGAYGQARFTLSHDQTSIFYTLRVSKTSTAAFMAHIHLGPPTQNGPVMLWLFGDPTHNPLPITLPRNDPAFINDGMGGGVVTGTLTAADFPTGNAGLADLGVTTFADAVANILQGNAYVNVHTVKNPRGEIRGQIMRNNCWGPCWEVEREYNR